MRSVVVGVMGDFTGWRRTPYKVELSGSHVVRKSRMSTIALYEAVEPQASEAYLVVVAPETLAALDRWSRRDGGRRLVDEVRNLPDPVEELRGVECFCPSAYTDFLERLRGFLAEWLRQEARRAGINKVEPSVYIAPAVGAYGYSPVNDPDTRRMVRWILRGPQGISPFSLFASTALLAVLGSLLRVGRDGDVALYVDLTHGVNYTSTALYRAALAAARLYSLAMGSKVEVSVYNSDPYPRGTKIEEGLRLWRIRWERIEPTAAASRAFYMTLTPVSKNLLDFNKADAKCECKGYTNHGDCVKLLEEYRKTVANYEDNIVRGVGYRNYALIASVSTFYGLPLLLLQAGGVFSEASSLASHASILEGLVDVLSKTPHLLCIEHHEDSVTIVRLGGLDFDKAKSLLALAAYSDYARRLYARYKQAGLVRWEEWSDSGTVPGRAIATIKALKELAESLPGPNYYIVKNEISKIEEAARCTNREKEDLCTNREKKSDLYCRICDAVKTRTNQPPPRGRSGFDPRTFTAHAGLSSGLIEVFAPQGGEGPTLAYAREILEDPQFINIAKNLAERLAKSVKAKELHS